MISIVSYGVGNISSIANMFRHVGVATQVVSSASEIRAASKLLLPGVGAFDYAIGRLRDAALVEPLTEAALERKTPILGICLGMQLMCRGSEEGSMPGLGWIDADVKRFAISATSDLKVPHMGWNTLKLHREDSVITRGDARQRFYFVHSYQVQCDRPEDVVATSTYGHEFTCAFSRDNVHGVQFHPEKSHRYGMALMKRFGEM